MLLRDGDAGRGREPARADDGRVGATEARRQWRRAADDRGVVANGGPRGPPRLRRGGHRRPDARSEGRRGRRGSGETHSVERRRAHREPLPAVLRHGVLFAPTTRGVVRTLPAAGGAELRVVQSVEESERRRLRRRRDVRLGKVRGRRGARGRRRGRVLCLSRGKRAAGRPGTRAVGAPGGAAGGVAPRGNQPASFDGMFGTAPAPRWTPRARSTLFWRVVFGTARPTNF